MALGRNISPGQGETYYRKDDYYLEREGGTEHKLKWGGKLAKELGLSGKADPEDWKKALNGQFPGGITIDGGGFKDPNTGELQKRAGTDFVVEAPKTVSMVYGLTDNERLKAEILKIQEEVESLSFGFLESKIGARRGHAGKTWETTGRALYGRVRHFVNRDGEAFLHGHGVFLNVTKNSDGTCQAMTNDKMMSYQRLAKEMGEAHWAGRLVGLGLEIERGKYGEVQIAGFSREQIEFASSRGQNIEKYLRDKWGVDRTHATQSMKDEAWEMTRKAKKVHELTGLEARWKEEGKLCGADQVVRKLEERFGKGLHPRPLSPEKRLKMARDLLAFAIDHHTERESAVKEGELIRTALQAGRGNATGDDIAKAVEEALTSGDLIRQTEDRKKQTLMTSREALGREKRIFRMEKEGRQSVEPILNFFQAETRIGNLEQENVILNDEQKAALRMMWTTDNRFSGINGSAGTGKTTLLRPAVEGLQAAGFPVLGLGPQHSAVHALNAAGILSARTLQSWLSDRTAEETLDQKTVVVIDESGLTNAKDLESAMRRIERAGARAVLVGDVKQYESVGAGAVFRTLQERGMETVRITEMQRQKNAPENIRDAAKLSVTDPAKALEKLDVREIRNAEDRYKAIAVAWLKSPDRKDTLVLTGTHEARKAVNAHVRDALGFSGKGAGFRTFEGGDHTEAQKKRIDSYEPGQEVKFGKNYRSFGIQAGEIGTIEAVNRESGTGVRLRMQDGRETTIIPRQMSGKGHEIGKTEPIELVSGDRIRITGNSLKKDGITNGMKGELLESKHDSLKIRLDSGKTFDFSPGVRTVELAYGYAQTGHSAQGLGAGTVILDLPAGSPTVNRRSFYTNLTRTTNQVVAFTDNREKLTGAVVREKDKSLAHDAIGKIPEAPHHSQDRLPEVAPDGKEGKKIGREYQQLDRVESTGRDPSGREIKEVPEKKEPPVPKKDTARPRERSRDDRGR